MRSKDLEMDILNRISRIQQRNSELIRPGSEVHEDYGFSRTFQQNSKSETQNRRFKDGDVDHNNR